MRLYVVLDRKSQYIYAISSKRWLARLFYIQRSKSFTNMTIVYRKSKISHRDYQYHDRRIHYFCGFAMLDEELRYIDLNLMDAGIDYYRDKYKKRRHQKIIDGIEDDLIKESIDRCIYRKSEVLERLDLHTEWVDKVR